MKKKGLVIALIVLLIVIIFFIFFISNFINQYNARIDSLTIEDININAVKNGIYEGFCNLVIIKVKVKVTVVNGAITEIFITQHENGKGKNAEAIINDVIAKQSLHVDTISGTTGSSKAILKAIEDALKKGM